MLTLAIALLVQVFFGQALSAQTDQDLNRDARQIFETVLSPYCPGRTISNCPSPQAEELRVSIKEQLAAGETPEDIKQELYATFGDELRTVPRARGFGLFAWIVPGLAFVGGVVAITEWVRRTKLQAAEASGPASVELDPEAKERLEAELAELESTL
jgi:cytochrome c-type biogenesis protein CcmH